MWDAGTEATRNTYTPHRSNTVEHSPRSFGTAPSGDACGKSPRSLEVLRVSNTPRRAVKT